MTEETETKPTPGPITRIAGQLEKARGGLSLLCEAGDPDDYQLLTDLAIIDDALATAARLITHACARVNQKRGNGCNY